MIVCIAEVITTDELQKLASLLSQAKFIDGKETAGWHSRLVKNNQQIPRHDLETEPLQELVHSAFQRNAMFQTAALPKQVSPIRFSRYGQGMSYGSHVDNAFMGEDKQLRSDLSVTLFLSDPDTYQGGELVIESSQGEQAFKLPAGAMILYPSTTLHRVETVTEGVRFAAVGWVQSRVRDSNAREILFDLETARRAIFAKQGKVSEFGLISKSYTNLLRRWGDC